MNVPVSCGGAVVMPGDAVLADESGVLVIPRDEVLAVAERALAMQDTGKAREASVRDAGARLGELSGASAKVLAGLGKVDARGERVFVLLYAGPIAYTKTRCVA